MIGLDFSAQTLLRTQQIKFERCIKRTLCKTTNELPCLWSLVYLSRCIILSTESQRSKKMALRNRNPNNIQQRQPIRCKITWIYKREGHGTKIERKFLCDACVTSMRPQLHYDSCHISAFTAGKPLLIFYCHMSVIINTPSVFLIFHLPFRFNNTKTNKMYISNNFQCPIVHFHSHVHLNNPIRNSASIVWIFVDPNQPVIFSICPLNTPYFCKVSLIQGESLHLL